MSLAACWPHNMSASNYAFKCNFQYFGPFFLQIDTYVVIESWTKLSHSLTGLGKKWKVFKSGGVVLIFPKKKKCGNTPPTYLRMCLAGKIRFNHSKRTPPPLVEVSHSSSNFRPASTLSSDPASAVTPKSL